MVWIMDSIKEIFDIMGQRIKSPVWGFIALAFIALNWQPLYFVLFSGEPAAEKFDFFDKNTDWISIYLRPLMFGTAFAVLSPRVSNWFIKLTVEPTNEKRMREVEEAHKISREKNRLSTERENEQKIHRQKLANDEQELIDQAKRDVEIDQLPDGVKGELQSQIDELRERDGSQSTNVLSSNDIGNRALNTLQEKYEIKKMQAEMEDRNGKSDRAEMYLHEAEMLLNEILRKEEKMLSR